MPPQVCQEMIKWCNQGNPSSGYKSATAARAMMSAFREYIGALCGINPCCKEPRDADSQDNIETRSQDPNMYKIIFTSGASEANCTIFQGIVNAYSEYAHNILPHVVMSAIEHKSLYEIAQSYEERGKITLTLVNPTLSGHIRPQDIEAAIRPNTCLICVMHANNETGAINDVKQIGAIAHAHNIPFHCDTAQTFGKYPINPITHNIDSLCVSFHKFQGPPGIGALIIKQQLMLGWKLQPLIYGTQNEGLRGGTENLPGIGAAFAATKLTMTARPHKNIHVAKLKKLLIQELSNVIPVVRYPQYVSGNTHKVAIVLLSGFDNTYMHNTILLSVVKKYLPYMCNKELKTDLESAGIIVSVGSACNTASPKASHVLFAMSADEYIRKGALRISLGDDNTSDDIHKFVREFIRVIKTQLDKIDEH
jgi:cysteine desulfurase